MNYSPRDALSDLLVVSLVGLFLWGAVHAFKPVRNSWRMRHQASAALRTPVPAGTLLADSWSVQSIANGERIPISRFQGKVLFINFWATWCGPCRQEMPSIEALYEKYRERDVVFLCASEEFSANILRYATSRDLKIPVYHIDAIPESFRATGLPSTYIVDRAGKVVLSRAGAERWDRKEIQALLDELLAKPAASLAL